MVDELHTWNESFGWNGGGFFWIWYLHWVVNDKVGALFVFYIEVLLPLAFPSL